MGAPSPLSSGEHHLDSMLSSYELVHDVAVDVGEAKVAAIVAEGEPFVIQAQQVEDGGVEVVMRDAVLDGVHAELVGSAVGNPRFDTAARHPHGEAEVVMAAAASPRARRGINSGEVLSANNYNEC